jgi:hypothetical protein
MRCSLMAPTPRIDYGWIVLASKPNVNGRRCQTAIRGIQEGKRVPRARPRLRLRPFRDSQKGEHADTPSLW